MSYLNAELVLPAQLVELIQSYIDGGFIYVPRKQENKRTWGQNTPIRQELDTRNRHIFMEHCHGISVSTLSEKYYLSQKSIQRIVLQEKRRKL